MIPVRPHLRFGRIHADLASLKAHTPLFLHKDGPLEKALNHPAIALLEAKGYDLFVKGAKDPEKAAEVQFELRYHGTPIAVPETQGYTSPISKEPQPLLLAALMKLMERQLPKASSVH